MNMEEELDIGFEANFVGTDYGNFNEVVNVVPWSRVRAPRWPEGVDGMYEPSSEGNLVIVFDNSYSWLKAKAVIFKTAVLGGEGGADARVPV